jgi:hypothetical protein
MRCWTITVASWRGKARSVVTLYISLSFCLCQRDILSLSRRHVWILPPTMWSWHSQIKITSLKDVRTIGGMFFVIRLRITSPPPPRLLSENVKIKIRSTISLYEGVSKSFRTGRLQRELHMVQLSVTRCSCIAILWVSLVSFSATTLCGASQQVFIIVVTSLSTQSGNFWIDPRMWCFIWMRSWVSSVV